MKITEEICKCPSSFTGSFYSKPLPTFSKLSVPPLLSQKLPFISALLFSLKRIKYQLPQLSISTPQNLFITLHPTVFNAVNEERSHFSASIQIFPSLFLTPFPTILKTLPVCYSHSYSLSLSVCLSFSSPSPLFLIFKIFLTGYKHAQESLLKINKAKILPRACIIL